MFHTESLQGHPQVYCRVIGEALLARGARVVIAAADAHDDWAERWNDLSVFKGDSRVTVVASPAGLSAEDLVALQQAHAIDSTLLIEADVLRPQFHRISAGVAPRLRGRVAAIFSRTTEWYPGEDFYSGLPLATVQPGLVNRLRRWNREWFQRERSDRYFFETVLMRKRVIDRIVVKDERIAARFGEPVTWMPEIYKLFNSVDNEVQCREFELWQPRLQDAISRVAPQECLLYFGAGAWYKGYDWFLELLARNPCAFGVHAGSGIRYENGKRFTGTPEATRTRLLAEGRLVETGGYVSSQRLVEWLFSAVPLFVSTHRLTVSSGTMLQALDAGTPVLVPETGLVGYRAGTLGLGLTYKYGDVEDMGRQWARMKTMDLAAARSRGQAFMERFSRAAVDQYFSELLLS